MWKKLTRLLVFGAALRLAAEAGTRCVPVYCAAGVVCDSGGDSGPLLLLGPLGGGPTAGLSPIEPGTETAGEWQFYATNTGSAAIDAAAGNSAPALLMTTGAGTGSPNGGKAFLYNTAYNGIRLNSLSTLTYDAYMLQSPSVWTLPYMNIFLDLDANGVFDATDVMLVYSRDTALNKDTLGRDLLLNTWQTWDPLNQGYWFTRQNGVWNWTPRDTATIRATYGTGIIVDPYAIPGTPIGGLQFVMGSSSGGLWANVNALLDNLHIGTGGSGSTVYGF